MKQLVFAIITLFFSFSLNAQCTIDLSMNGTFVDELTKDTVRLKIEGMEVTFKDVKGNGDGGSISKIEVHITPISEMFTMVTFYHNWDDLTIILDPNNKDEFSVFERFVEDEYGDPTRDRNPTKSKFMTKREMLLAITNNGLGILKFYFEILSDRWMPVEEILVYQERHGMIRDWMRFRYTLDGGHYRRFLPGDMLHIHECQSDESERPMVLVDGAKGYYEWMDPIEYVADLNELSEEDAIELIIEDMRSHLCG